MGSEQKTKPESSEKKETDPKKKSAADGAYPDPEVYLACPVPAPLIT